MTDPYNSAPLLPANPYAPPKAPVLSAKLDPIARLDVSDKWKEIFRLIDDAGGPSLAGLRNLDRSGRRRVQTNWWALFFGPLYYLAKGLWLPAVTVFAVAVGVGMLFEAMGFGDVRFGVGVGILCSMRANVLYYRLKVLGERSWM